MKKMSVSPPANHSNQSKSCTVWLLLLPLGTPSCLPLSLPPNPSSPSSLACPPHASPPRVPSTHPENLPANARVAAPAARLVVLQVARHDVGCEVPVIDDLFVLVRLDFRLSDGGVGRCAAKAEQPGHRAEGGSSAPQGGHECCGGGKSGTWEAITCVEGRWVPGRAPLRRKKGRSKLHRFRI